MGRGGGECSLLNPRNSNSFVQKKEEKYEIMLRSKIIQGIDPTRTDICRNLLPADRQGNQPNSMTKSAITNFEAKDIRLTPEKPEICSPEVFHVNLNLTSKMEKGKNLNLTPGALAGEIDDQSLQKKSSGVHEIATRGGANENLRGAAWNHGAPTTNLYERLFVPKNSTLDSRKRATHDPIPRQNSKKRTKPERSIYDSIKMFKYMETSSDPSLNNLNTFVAACSCHYTIAKSIKSALKSAPNTNQIISVPLGLNPSPTSKTLILDLDET